VVAAQQQLCQSLMGAQQPRQSVEADFNQIFSPFSSRFNLSSK
jgi:hypothetical protein